jgi:ABC-type uncharacterized transport system substrate-binding protein
MKLNNIMRAVFAFLLAAGILLLFDIDNRKKSVKPKELPKIAIFKIASRVLLDNAETGIIEALSDNGFDHNKTCIIKHFCAEGDIPNANLIAQNIINSKYDIVITISTPALQIMANANKEGVVKHVFCAVTDPYVSGVGITGTLPEDHPPHLAGIGTFQPVEKAFEIAKIMNPGLKKVGTVWCTSETCSEACVRLARIKCAELGIELVEMSVESSTQVLEAAMSLTARGIEALWLGGDNVVEIGIDQLITAANKAKIPLFTNTPYDLKGNKLFAVGAEYIDVGRIAGKMASEILNGKSPSEYGIENVMPLKIMVNPDALKNINSKWEINNIN